MEGITKSNYQGKKGPTTSRNWKAAVRLTQDEGEENPLFLGTWDCKGRQYSGNTGPLIYDGAFIFF